MSRNLNLPNFLSLSRIVFLPILYIFVFSDMPFAFLIAFIILGSTDFLDGYLARKLNQVTPLGKALDTVADMFFYFSTAYFIFLLYPEYLSPNTVLLLVFLGVYICAYVLSIVYYKRPVQVHTTILRLGATLVYALVILSYMFDTTHVITIILITFILGCLEEMWMFIRFGPVDIDTKSIWSLYKTHRKHGS
ncbi:MAG: CDP-alcohol phosphatidyltransferase family protein [Acholeplasmataceae bacterium]|nr:CDP-alcohol phosphatidyltransferase family protein [Acholeplasmataceae bacterium]